MTDLLKLADIWCDPESTLTPAYKHAMKNCAQDLRAALPPWVTISMEPSTWPDKTRDVIFESHGRLVILRPFSRPCYPFEIGKRWRYMIDIDYPPKEEN